VTSYVDAALDVLTRAGVRNYYTVPGESFLPLLRGVDARDDLRLISTRHESGASFMAEAEGKLTGKPAVVMATRAVGATNASIGVHTAHQDSTPMIVLLGQVPTTMTGREAFQEIDLEAFYRPLTKWTTSLTQPDRLPEVLDRAVRVATTGRPGPVLVALPTDVLEAAEERQIPAATPMPAPLTMAHGTADDEAVASLAQALAQARNPVVIAGGGAATAREELIRFAEAYNVGVYASFRRQDVFPNRHPLYLGHLTLGTSPSVAQALREADFVFVVGCRLSETTTLGYELPKPGTPVVQLDATADVIAAAATASTGIAAAVGPTLRRLLEHAPSSVPQRDWTPARNAYLGDHTLPEPAASGITAFDVVRAMREVLPEDCVVTNDAGNFSVFLHRFWPYNHPRTQLAPTSGAMGYAVPAAVGAQIARPDSRVVAVAGDGGFLMTGQELETAARYKLPITVIVMRNGMYGTIAMHMANRYRATAATDILDVDCAQFARSLGATGISVTSGDDLAPAIAAALATDGPTVVDVQIDPDRISPRATLTSLLTP
jgi:acetolactate synthase-1/2/3 large subunit